jgi:lambda repressor-like predicted transcriptional regulator
MSNTWRDVIPLNQAIIKAIRSIVGMEIKKWAKIKGLNRVQIYNAAKGKSTRKYRIELAIILGETPSKIWPDRSNVVKQRDDKEYQRLTQGDV